MNPQIWTAAGAAIAILLSAWVVRRLQRLRKSSAYRAGEKTYRLLKFEEKVVLALHRTAQYALRGIRDFFKESGTLMEILLLGLWAVWLGREYLDISTWVLPAGREFSSAIQTHHLWTRFLECGWCALWNGSAPGGAPAFADPYGSMLHPLVVLPTLILGVVNGAKISLVLAFWAAGIAQWWIARELQLSRLARLWSSALAVAGGHLAGRMELGLFGIVLSTAMTSLLFAATLAAVNRPGRKSAVVLGLTGASALLAGQGYLQLAFAGTIPACVFLVFDRQLKIKPVWKTLLVAGILALLLAAVFLVPFLRFSPHFSKFMDAEFQIAQPLQYLPLNFVIDSEEFFYNESLAKSSFPALHTLFIGWVPVMLAACGLTDTRKLNRSTKWYLASSILLILLMASGTSMRLLVKLWPGAAGFRHTPLMAGLAVPPMLALAAAGLDLLFRQDWPQLALNFSRINSLKLPSLPVSWLLVIPLALNLHTAYRFADAWIYTARNAPDVYRVVDALKTDSLQWVEPPFGEHFFIEPAVARGLKISPGIIPWIWNDREIPAAYLEANRAGSIEGSSEILASVDGVNIFIRPEVEYASLDTGNRILPCTATGQGGAIDVTCSSDKAGTLILREFMLPGWKVRVDGVPTPLSGSTWLSISVPAGFQQAAFRYQPWDVPLGLLLSLLGIGLCLWLWITAAPAELQPQAGSGLDQQAAPAELQPQAGSGLDQQAAPAELQYETGSGQE